MRILSLIFIVAAIFEAKLFKSGYPLLSLSLLLPISLNMKNPRTLLILAFFGGLLRDGIYSTLPWITPAYFTIVAMVGLFYRSYVNINLLTPKIIFFSISIIFYFILIVVILNTNCVLLSLFKSFIFTLLIALLIDKLL